MSATTAIAMTSAMREGHSGKMLVVEPSQPFVRRFGAAPTSARPDERVTLGKLHADRSNQLRQPAIVARDLATVRIPELRHGPCLDQDTAVVLHDAKVLVELGEERASPANGRERLVAQRRQPVDALDVRLDVN